MISKSDPLISKVFSNSGMNTFLSINNQELSVFFTLIPISVMCINLELIVDACLEILEH